MTAHQLQSSKPPQAPVPGRVSNPSQAWSIPRFTATWLYATAVVIAVPAIALWLSATIGTAIYGAVIDPASQDEQRKFVLALVAMAVFAIWPTGLALILTPLTAWGLSLVQSVGRRPHLGYGWAVLAILPAQLTAALIAVMMNLFMMGTATAVAGPGLGAIAGVFVALCVGVATAVIANLLWRWRTRANGQAERLSASEGPPVDACYHAMGTRVRT